MLQTLNHLHNSVLDLVQHVHIFLILGSPALDNPDVASPVMSREDHLNHVLAALFLMQTLGLLCWKGTLLAYRQLAVQDPKVHLCRAAFQPVGPRYVLVHGVVPPQMHDFSLPLVEPNEIPCCPILQPVLVPLNGSTTIWCMSYSFQFCILCEVAEGAPCPRIQVRCEAVLAPVPIPGVHH